MANEFNISVEGVRPRRVDWEAVRNTLAAPRGLGLWTRMRLERQGRNDARKGLVYVDPQGNFISVYCRNLINQTNLEIETEWQECDGKMFAIKRYLDSILHQREVLQAEQAKLTGERGKALDRARAVSDEDLPISSYLKRRRRSKREERVRTSFEGEEQRIERDLVQTEMDAIAYIQDYRNAEDIAISHESMHRIDFLRRLSAYAYGASSYVRVLPEMISDSLLSDKPREKHNALFEDYRKAFAPVYDIIEKSESSRAQSNDRSAGE